MSADTVSQAIDAARWCGARVGPITILTGAGVSAESGLATFRGADGLWEGHRIDEVATPEAFARNPRLVHTFYNERRAKLRDSRVVPNAAHRALAELAARWPAPVHLITQNVDDLHERGGSPAVIHMHGELTKVRNDRTGEVFTWEGECWSQTPCPRSGECGVLRPHIVWFGEAIMETERIEAALAHPAIFLCIGTAGAVWPAAGFVDQARSRGAACIEFNLARTQISGRFDRTIEGTAGESVPAFIDALRAART